MQTERDQYRQQLSAMHVIVDSARRSRPQPELDNAVPAAATSECADILSKVAVSGACLTDGARCTASTPVAAAPGPVLSASASTDPVDVISNGSSLALETDRAVKSKVEEAIQQGPKQLLDLMQQEMADIR